MHCKMTNKNQLTKMIVAMIAATVIFSFLGPLKLSGQEKNEEVNIIAPYNPTVTASQKINRNPKMVFSEPRPLPEIEYEINTMKISTGVTPDNPRPARVPGEPRKDLYRSHIRAGFGTYITPYFELWVNSLQSDDFNAGAHIGHLSSFGEIKNYAKSSFSNTIAEAYASKYFNNNSIGGKIYYSNQTVHRYGFMPADFPQFTFDDKDLRQAFNKVGLDFNLASNNTETDAFNYAIKFQGYHLFDRFESTETGLFAGFDIAKKTDLFNNRRSQETGIKLSTDYYLNKDSISDYKGGIVSATPFIDLDLKPYSIFIGLKFDYRMDTASKLHFYPLIRAEAALIENTLTVYAALDGGSKRISYDRLVNENPFVNSILPLDYSHTYEFSGGIKGRIAEIVDYDAGAEFSLVDNMPMFVNDTATITQNTFDLVYDAAGIFSVFGELGFRSRSDFGISMKAAYHSYAMDNEEKAWHKPSLELSLNSFYVIREKLTLNAGLNSFQGVYARSFVNREVVPVQIDGWFDLSLGAEYRITEQFSAFIRLNNLLNNGYFRWYQYPVQKFNVLAGLGFSF